MNAVIRNSTEIESIAIRIEDENTVSADAADYTAFLGHSGIRPYIVAVINRHGHRYDLSGIVNGRAYFTR